MEDGLRKYFQPDKITSDMLSRLVVDDSHCTNSDLVFPACGSDEDS